VNERLRFRFGKNTWVRVPLESRSRMERKDRVDTFGAVSLIAFSALLAFNQVVIAVVNEGLQPVFFAGVRWCRHWRMQTKNPFLHITQEEQFNLSTKPIQILSELNGLVDLFVAAWCFALLGTGLSMRSLTTGGCPEVSGDEKSGAKPGDSPLMKPKALFADRSGTFPVLLTPSHE